MGDSPQDEERLLGTVTHLREITRRYLCRIRIRYNDPAIEMWFYTLT